MPARTSSPLSARGRPFSREWRGWRLGLVMTVLCGALAAPGVGASGGPGKRTHSGSSRDATLTLQVLLDRAGFSVGEIDGAAGAKTRKALIAYQRAQGLPATGVADPDTIAALGGERPSTAAYLITAEDVAGPFVDAIPADLVAQGELPALSYTSPLELIAERFHASPKLLRRLNPNARFVEGETIAVPGVEPTVFPTQTERRNQAPEAAARTATVIVSKDGRDLVVESVDGQILMYAPVSSGSEHDPLPIGEWRVTDLYLKPQFNYNPELFWDADPSHGKTKIPPGPNNPVGLAWIDLDREHYGLHGTPEPATVGVTQSHGCVRLTNWDVTRLAALVRPGTRVVFQP